MAEFLKCNGCARIVKVVQEGKGDLICCGQAMQPLGNFESTLGVLDFAIEKEAEAREFYLEWADKLKDEHLRKLFRELAAEEQKHKEKLERVKGGSVFRGVPGKVTDLKIVDYLVDIVPTPEMDYQDALIIAMRRERSAFKLYNDLAAMGGVEETRDLFMALAQEEARHKLRLETEYEKDIIREN